MEGGDTSDTYMGESSETAPTASPPRKRATTKDVKLPAAAVAIGGQREEDRDQDQQSPAAVAVGEPSGDEGAHHASERGAS